MIIWGTRGITSTKASGRFYCPQCGAGSPYHRKQVRRHFTLYFIPIIPLDERSEYVECATCQGTYHLGVLKFDPESEERALRAAFHEVTLVILIKMMHADGELASEEIELASEVYAKLTRRPPDPDLVRRRANALQADTQSVRQYLAAVRGRLNDHGKEQVLRAAVAVAAADGSVAATESRLLLEIGEALEMTRAHVRGVLQEHVSG